MSAGSNRFAILKRMIVLALMGAIIATGSVFAQNGGVQPDRVRAELETTDQLIEQATTAVTSSNSAVADQSLKAARVQQDHGWDMFNRQMYRQSLKFTLQARELAKKAISRSRTSELAEGVVLQKLERANDLLDRTDEKIGATRNPSLNSLMESSRDNLSRAWEFYRGRQYQPAIKLADQVEKVAGQLGRLANMQDREALQFLRNREQAEVFLEQSRERITDCDSDRVRTLLEKAEEALTVADDFADQDQYRAGNQALKKVRDITWQAVRECQGTDQLAGRYERLLADADRLNEEVLEYHGDQAETARELIDQAYDQLSRARKHITDQQTEAAMTALQAAQLALRQADRYISSGE